MGSEFKNNFNYYPIEDLIQLLELNECELVIEDGKIIGSVLKNYE